MRCVIQRVTEAFVTVEGKETGRIGRGYCALIGVEAGDTEQDARYLAGKIAKLRVFEDDQGKMNRALADVGGGVLAISQFTLLGDARGQNRPSFIRAEAPDQANALYEACCRELRALGIPVETGVFRTHMAVHILNDGPVTILLDSRKTF